MAMNQMIITMKTCSRISIIDKRIITFLFQGNYSVFLFLITDCFPLTTFLRCRIEILPQPFMVKLKMLNVY